MRRISVDSVIYRWRFCGGELTGTLHIYGPNSGGQTLKVHSQQWCDLWLSFPLPPGHAPVVVTPALVRRAIEFALSHGWDAQARGGAFEFCCCNDKFTLTSP